jgi:hypothetical protein
MLGSFALTLRPNGVQSRAHIEVYCANYPAYPEWRITELKKIEMSETNLCKGCSYVSSCPSCMDSNAVGP